MAELYLLRHAKSDWASQGTPDRDRTLAPRGIEDASAMGAYMQRAGYCPDTTLCSDAARTRQTLDLVTKNWSHSHTTRFSDTLYSGAAQAYFDLVRGLPETCSAAMLLAHNPTIHQLALAMSGDGTPNEMAALSKKFPTCGLAVIRFATDTWSDLGQGDGTLVAFITQKTIPQAKEDK